MTAVIARTPLENLPNAMNRKRKADYDENDDGFKFTRRTSKRTAKAQPAQPAPDAEPSQLKPRRRSARLSSDKSQLDTRANSTEALAKQLPKRTKKPATTPAAKKKASTPAPEPEPKPAPVQTPKNEIRVAKRRETKIMLPFADTPVITRNKEMRKASKDGHRRSSTGLRGRRASSLIDSGMSNALPHSEIEIRDFYKYIEQSLPEPRRMKQLLTWCGSRALPEKPSGNVKDANAIMAARAIQQELIDDFASKPELSDWFSREDTIPTSVVKKPNPINDKNKATLQELEEEVKRLEEEKAAWESLSSASNIMAPPPPSIHTSNPTLSEVDASLLDPEQAAILAALQTQPEQSAFSYLTPVMLGDHLSKLSSNLEPNVDLLADGLHKIEQYRNTAERIADRVLGTASKRLEDRERESKEQVGSEGIGARDLLRGLSGVLNE